MMPPLECSNNFHSDTGMRAYTEISHGGFICAITVTTKLTNQISSLGGEVGNKIEKLAGFA